jgi:hypothetical protein
MNIKICKYCSCNIKNKPWLSYKFTDDIYHLCSYSCSLKNGSVGVENIINKEDFNFWAVPITDMRYYQNFDFIDNEEYENMDEIEKLKYDMEYQHHLDNNAENFDYYNDTTSGDDDDDYEIFSDTSSQSYESDYLT